MSAVQREGYMRLGKAEDTTAVVVVIEGCAPTAAEKGQQHFQQSSELEERFTEQPIHLRRTFHSAVGTPGLLCLPPSLTTLIEPGGKYRRGDAQVVLLILR